MKDSQKMEGRKAKRGKGKTTGGHARVAEKKKKTQVMNEKEEMDRLEAASVLSSLMFLPPKSSEGSNENSPVHPEPNGVVSSTSTVTYISAAPSTGIPTRGPPQGPQSLQGGSGTTKLVTAPIVSAMPRQAVNMPTNSVIVAQLQNQVNFILNNGQAHSHIQLMMPLQVQALSKPMATATKSNVTTVSSVTTVPSIVKHAETPKLPVTLNIGQTVNRDVATALRQAVTSTSKKTMQDGASFRTKQSKTDKAKATETFKSSQSSGNQLPSSVIVNDPTSAAKKKDNSDNNLPLKKRRLIAVGNASSSEASELGSKVEKRAVAQDIPSTRLSDLTSAVQIENILQMAREYSSRREQRANSVISCSADSKSQEQGEGYRPVQIDPRTSLMILSDVKVALTPDQDGDLPIHIAVVHENLDLVKKLIDIMGMSGKSLDRYNKLQQTPLHLAILVNKPDIIAALLAAGANPNLVDRHGCTSLHIAVTKQFPECLQAVFNFTEMKLQLNTRNYDGYPPLHTCVDLNDLHTLEYLVQHGANVDAQDGKAGRNAVFYATEYNRVKMVDFLIASGANADMNNYASVSPLMVAQSGNMTEIMSILQKALDMLKQSDEPQDGQTRKVPIPRIPSKSSLIVPDASFRSRSNSEDRRSPAVRTRTPSVSSCPSPIDLSIGKSMDSPKELTRVKQERITPVNTVKEKHTQLVAALEGRNVVEKTQGANTNVTVSSRPVTETAIRKPFEESYIPTKSSEEVDLRMKSEQMEDESQVTSSSDLPQTGKVHEKVSGKSDKMELEVQPLTSETVVINSGNTEEMETDKTEDSVGALKQKSECSKTAIPVSDRIETKVSRNESSDVSDFADIEMSTGNSPSTSSSVSGDSPEMPVLSRMASFSNEHDSCSTSVAEDVPDIDKEQSSDAVLENSSETPAKSPVKLETQRSQESLQSSLGFDTETAFNRKLENTDSEMDSLQENSLKSDDSVELDNATLAKFNVYKVGINKDNVKQTGTVSDDKTCESLPSVNVVQDEDMETDEEDEEKPLVIDESPMETNVAGEEDNSSDNVSKITENKEDFSVSTSELTQAVTASKEERKTRESDTYVDLSVKRSSNEIIVSDHRNNPTENTTMCVVSEGDSKDLVEEKAVKSKQQSITDTTSNGVIDSSEHVKNKVSASSPSSPKSEHSSEKSKLPNKDEFKSKIDKDKDRKDKSSAENKDRVVTEADTKSDSESRESSSLGSVDHLLKDGKSHTLFYHDGEGYKPIRIFIDNSEQSSLVLQKMLQASFSNLPVNQTTSSKQSASNSASPSTELSVETQSKSVNSKDVKVKQSKALTESLSIKTAKVSDEKESSQKKLSNHRGHNESGSVERQHVKEDDSASTSGNRDGERIDKPVNLPDSSNTSHVKRLPDKLSALSDKVPVLSEKPGVLASTVVPTSKPSFQMAYIDSLNRFSRFESPVDESKKLFIARNVQNISDKSISSSSDGKADSHSNKRLKINNGNNESDKLPGAVKFPESSIVPQNSVAKTSDKLKDTTNKSRETKIVEVNAADKIIKLHIKQEVPAKSKPTISLPSELAVSTLSSSSSFSTSQTPFGRVFHTPSRFPLKTFTPPPQLPVKVTGFQPGRISLSEGTLTRVNPDIKNRLSMALQSPQRKLGKPNAGLSSQEYELKYPNLQGIVGNTPAGSFDSVTPQSVSDARQQL